MKGKGKHHSRKSQKKKLSLGDVYQESSGDEELDRRRTRLERVGVDDRDARVKEEDDEELSSDGAFNSEDEEKYAYFNFV